MKLYLSSNDIPNMQAFEKLVGKSCDSIKMALITNAKDYYNDLLRRYKADVGIAKFEELGMNVTEIDLRDYHNEAEKLKDNLKEFDVVWGLGGNSFCLRSEMQLSGFDRVIRSILDEGVVYGGESAGAIVASRTLRGIESVDLPAATNNVIWEGIGLTNHIIMPHADGINFQEVIQVMRLLHGEDPEYLELNDNQALVIQGEQEQIVSEGKNNLEPSSVDGLNS